MQIFTTKQTSLFRSKRLPYLLPFIFFFTHFSIYANIKSVTLTAGKHSLQKNEDMTMRIVMDDFGTISIPGSPQLPCKTFYIPLPARSCIQNITFNLSIPETIDLGTDVSAASPIIGSAIHDNEINAVLDNYTEQKNKIYQTNAFFPDAQAINKGIGYLRDRPILKVQFFPFAFNPITKKLNFVEKVTVDIDYTTDENNLSNASSENKSLKTYESYLDNQLNKTSWNNTTTSDQAISLIIISSESLKETIDPFIFWKSCIGISTEFISVEWINSNSTGNDLTEKIRNVLREKYFNENQFDHVLLIGNRDIVPIKYLYPNPDDHNNSAAVPSDIYYAEYSSEWDGDNDGYPGEYYDDNIDLFTEVSVGRIPWSDSESIGMILEKCIAFEKDNSGWKTNSLLIGAMSNYVNEDNQSYFFRETDGACLMEILKGNVFNTGTTTTLYEKDGIAPSTFSCNLPLNKDNVMSTWSNQSIGCMTWWAHGNIRAAYRKIWRQDNGDNIPESTEISYEKFISTSDYQPNTQFQPIVFANACENGYPESSSLGRQMIRNGCTGIVSSSRLSYAVMGWNEISDGGNSSLAYYFWDNYINKRKNTGDALTFSRLTYQANHYHSWVDLDNIYTYNYYGDPTTQVNNVVAIYGGLSGKLISDDDEFISEVEISIDGLNMSSVTDSNGKFNLFKLLPGNYLLKLMKNSQPLYEMTATITAGEMADYTIELDSETLMSFEIANLALSATLHESFSTSISLPISNNCYTPIEYQMIFDLETENWLTTDSTSHAIQPNQMDTLQIFCSAENLQHGEYDSQLQFITNQPLDSTLFLPIHLTVIDTIAPAPITDLWVSERTNNLIHMKWTAPGDNQYTGQAEKYEIWASDQPMIGTSFENASKLLEIPSPKTGGSQEEFILETQNKEITQWYVIKTFDEMSYQSLSNEIVVQAAQIVQFETAQTSLNATLQETFSTSILFTITNTGNTPIGYQLHFDEGMENWLTTDTTSHAIQPDQMDTLQIFCSAENLQHGEYDSQLQFITNQPLDSTLIFPVHLTVIDTVAPAPISDLELVEIMDDSISLEWTAPGDNRYTGQAEKYEIWVSDRPMIETSFENAIKLCEINSPKLGGIREELTLPIENKEVTHWYVIKTFDEMGYFSYSNEVCNQTTGLLSENSQIPTDFLTQNYPNPFNSQTTIKFGISEHGRVTINIFDEIGRKIATLLDEDIQAGQHTLSWDARDNKNNTLPSGRYYYRIVTKNQSVTKKMILLK